MYEELVKRLTYCRNNAAIVTAEELVEIADAAADAIEELLEEREKYRHAAFVIGETCVEESKCHISTDDAIQKIREHIYYSGQMPLQEPPKEEKP